MKLCREIDLIGGKCSAKEPLLGPVLELSPFSKNIVQDITLKL
jgi:hypothetical protein